MGGGSYGWRRGVPIGKTRAPSTLRARSITRRPAAGSTSAAAWRWHGERGHDTVTDGIVQLRAT